ncbi:MAG: heme d1 biosynthesis radical SAM protein NirJ [Rhodospirillaceae bacterium]|nr:heme d1 biosynthesis radical SAM protein NirJ [Rhodospirillales bacterium]
MFRLTQFMRELDAPTPVGPRRNPPGPVVIWNLVRRCNLACRHCYSISADKDFPNELTTGEIFTTLADLRGFGVPALILSGGEPLLRPDLFEITTEAKRLGFSVSLSTNGTLIDPAMAERIRAAQFDYVGISIDGIGAVHDRFRGRDGAYTEAMRGISLLGEAGLKVGLRFTMTRDNRDHLPDVLGLAADKFYLSHLNYAGRANRNRADDAECAMTRSAMDLLFERCLSELETGRPREYVTGNNDADGPYFLSWVTRRFPERAAHIQAKLVQWGGNASGVNVANIDNLGNVHPDTMWGHARLGNVRERPFSAIWADDGTPLMAGLRAHPRKLKGRCGGCRWLSVCNGNSRVRAEKVSGDRWGEDPGCYLTDEEIAA